MNRRTFLTSALAGASLMHSKLSWCDFSPAVTEPVKAARRVAEVYLNMRFNNFVVGAANLMAVATASNRTEYPGNHVTPLVIYGGAGTGKSHLAHAVVNEFVRRNPGLKAHRIGAWHFLADMEYASRQGAFGEIMRNYKSLDLLFVDGVQLLQKAPIAQAALQSIFGTLQKRRRQMLFTTDVHPKDMQGLAESLKNRLGSGYAITLNKTDLYLRRDILKRYAVGSGLEIESEALDLIAMRVQSCPRELEGLVKRFSALSRFHELPITLGIVEAELQRVGWFTNKERLRLKCSDEESASYLVEPLRHAPFGSSLKYLLRRYRSS